MVRGSAVLGLSLLVACKGGDDADPTGSATVVASRSGEAVYALNADEGTLSIVPVEAGRTREIELGVDPARVTRVGDRVWVTLAGEGTVVELEEKDDSLVERSRHRVGSEPVGIVASPDGKSIYVAITLEDRVEERDADTFERTRSWEVQDQPRWLAMHPSGSSLFVASALRGTVTRIDLRDGATHDIDLPETTRDTAEGTIPLGPRLTGDPGITPDGSSIALPGLYVDNLTPVEEPTDDGPVQNGYASSGGLTVSRMNPAIVTYDLDPDGAVVTGSGKPIFAGAINRRGETVRSMPTSAVSGPDGEAWVVTLEGSDAVLLVSRSAFRGQGDDPSRGGGDVTFTSTDFGDTGGGEDRTPITTASGGGFWERPVLVMTAAGGPRGVAFTDRSTGWIHGWLGRNLAEIGYAAALPALEEIARQEGQQLDPSLGAPRVIAESALPDDVERGRLLFHSAIDTRMAGEGAGVSCATCHLGLRSDGIVWTFEDGVRNTLSLAGDPTDTAPFTWAGTVDSVAQEAELTSQGRMGGDGISASDLADLEAYIAAGRPVDAPNEAADLVALGAELFARTDVGCATCHTGEKLTDNANHVILDLPAQTPSLVGVVATPPYFHDGSALTLRDVLNFARDGGMGDTSGLAEQEMDALEAFLRSL